MTHTKKIMLKNVFILWERTLHGKTQKGTEIKIHGRDFRKWEAKSKQEIWEGVCVK